MSLSNVSNKVYMNTSICIRFLLKYINRKEESFCSSHNWDHARIALYRNLIFYHKKKKKKAKEALVHKSGIAIPQIIPLLSSKWPLTLSLLLFSRHISWFSLFHYRENKVVYYDIFNYIIYTINFFWDQDRVLLLMILLYLTISRLTFIVYYSLSN